MPTRLSCSALTLLALLVPAILSCTTSTDGIVLDDGFTAVKLQDHRFLVKFERAGISVDTAKKNLLFHSARLTMDDGAIFFSMENLESASKVEREYINRTIEAVPQLDPDNPQSGAPGSSTTEQYSTGVSLHNVVTVAAIVTTFRESPEDRSVMEASRVFEQLTAKQRRDSD